MAELTQAQRKAREARTVAWIGRVIGISSLGVTGVLATTAAHQTPDTVLFKSKPVAHTANYETARPAVTEVVVEEPVPSPLPPTHIPVYAGPAGPVAQVGQAGGYSYQAAAPMAALGAPPAVVIHTSVVPPPPVPVPAPTAVSSGSVPH